jgi:hypothetical protein
VSAAGERRAQPLIAKEVCDEFGQEYAQAPGSRVPSASHCIGSSRTRSPEPIDRTGEHRRQHGQYLESRPADAGEHLVGILFCLLGYDIATIVFLPNLPFELGTGLWLAIKGIRDRPERASLAQVGV